jgi:myo-inositol 2-dehydrogenase/D-chiro-inositol 1-dehydrogenase
MTGGATVLVHSLQGGAALADQLNLESIATFDELLARCDVIDIVSPGATHADYVVRAANAEKHVVCEKPLALDARDAQRCAQAAVDAGVHLLVGHVCRFTPPYRELHAAISRGRVGKVAVARFERSTPGPRRESWYADELQSGGVVTDLMIHDLDLARWICGEVVSVYAVRHSEAAGDPHHLIDGAQAVLTHADGAISTVCATWASAHEEFSFRFSVSGPLGTITYDSATATGLTAHVPQSEDSRLQRARSKARAHSYATELHHFLDVLRGDAQPAFTPQDAVTAVALADAVRESLRTGQPVAPSQLSAGAEREQQP